MKKLLVLILMMILNSCTGYEAAFSQKKVNFYIEEIKSVKNDKISNKIVKKLKPYTFKTNKNEIKLEIDSSSEERIISKDAKGNPKVFELNVMVNIIIYQANKQKKLSYAESFSYGNQSNKFELNQYKKDVVTNLTNNIFEKLILDLKLNL